MKKYKVALACDHAGFFFKEEIIKFLIKEGYEVKDFGTYSQESADYPDFAHPMAYSIESGEYDYGVSLCGSGNGINMTVNKHQGIRSALCWNTEIARLARLHNNANVCAIPARFVTLYDTLEILKLFFKTEFEGGRHLRRINKVPVTNKK